MIRMNWQERTNELWDRLLDFVEDLICSVEMPEGLSVKLTLDLIDALGKIQRWRTDTADGGAEALAGLTEAINRAKEEFAG